eukprot:m.211333 g.211333  ORF g.211333 m.211333 type:complete len:99 (+) comp15492_c0_seq2:392-688(+)
MHRWADDLASQRRNPDRNEHFIHDLNHQPPALKRGTCSPSYIAGPVGRGERHSVVRSMTLPTLGQTETRSNAKLTLSRSTIVQRCWESTPPSILTLQT